jgi:glycosyltransferase involved in cell wall biosynthesis
MIPPLRLLIITTDESVSEAGSVYRERILELGNILPELHVILCTTKKKQKIERAAPHLWIYSTNSYSRFFYLLDMWHIVQSQITFRFRLRAGLILTDHSFLATRFGRFISRLYRKPHHIDDALITHFDPKIYGTKEPTVNLHTLYPQFNVILFTFYNGLKPSQVKMLLEILQRLTLRYKRPGLILAGTGQSTGIIQTAKGVNLENQVICIDSVEDRVSYYKTTNVFLSLAIDNENTTYLKEAAASGCPIIAVSSELASKLIVPSTGFICEENSIDCFMEHIFKIIESPGLREELRLNIQAKAAEVFSEDLPTYLKRYVNTLREKAGLPPEI